MIQVYKIMHQKDRIDPDTFFQLAESTTRGHELKLNKPRHNTNLRGTDLQPQNSNGLELSPSRGNQGTLPQLLQSKT